jgi:hypothetical protein
VGIGLKLLVIVGLIGSGFIVDRSPIYWLCLALIILIVLLK